MPSLNKKALPGVLDAVQSDRARTFMAIRGELSKTSTKKYETFLNYTCADGHAKGCFMFHGGHTGRFSCKGLQLQNIVKNSMPDLDDVREIVRDGDYEFLRAVYPSVTNVLSELIRTTLIPEEGHKFCVADFSAIEARVSAWLAGEEWVLKAFEDGQDIYCATASAMFKVPVVKNGENGELRQKGKIATLACVAEGQLVLTDRGLVPIEDIRDDDLLWDGENWVMHEGLVFNGLRDTVFIGGIEVTPDHKILTEKGMITADEAEGLNWAAVHAPIGTGTRPGPRASEWPPSSPMGMPMRLRKADPCRDRASDQEEKANAFLRMPSERPYDCEQDQTRNDEHETLLGVERDEAEVLKSQRRRVSSLWWAWNPRKPTLAGKLRGLFVRHGRDLSTGASARPKGQRRTVLAGKLPVGKPQRECQKQEKHAPNVSSRKKLSADRSCRKSGNPLWNATVETIPQRRVSLADGRSQIPVFDILNAGAKHRFCIYDPLTKQLRCVSNCGYGGGVGALKAFGADRMGLSPEEMAGIIDTWRAANPHIVMAWKSLGNAAIRCITHQGTFIDKVCGIRFRWDKGVMWMRLPSGREMAYYHPQYGPSEFNPQEMVISYMGVHQQKRKWLRIETRGSRILENLVQATSRDILREAMFALDRDGWDIRAHVHDEVICTEPLTGRSADEMARTMCPSIPWAAGLPLKAEGYECSSYRKA